LRTLFNQLPVAPQKFFTHRWKARNISHRLAKTDFPFSPPNHPQNGVKKSENFSNPSQPLTPRTENSGKIQSVLIFDALHDGRKKIRGQKSRKKVPGTCNGRKSHFSTLATSGGKFYGKIGKTEYNRYIYGVYAIIWRKQNFDKCSVALKRRATILHVLTIPIQNHFFSEEIFFPLTKSPRDVWQHCSVG
jgi:hypothetical protein